MENKSKISIVLPCHNPKPGWEQTLVYYYKLLLKRIPSPFDINLVIVDDGSTKGIEEEQIGFIKSQIPSLVFIKNPVNKGKGFALRSAVSQVESDYIIYTDYDLPYEIANLINTVSLLTSNQCNIVIGIRDSSYLKSLPLKRKILSRLLCVVNYIFLPGMFVKDTQSGLKGFDRAGRELFMKTSINTYLFDTEFINMASRVKNIKMAKLKIRLRKGIGFSQMNNKVLLREFLNYFKIIFKS